MAPCGTWIVAYASRRPHRRVGVAVAARGLRRAHLTLRISEALQELCACLHAVRHVVSVFPRGQLNELAREFVQNITMVAHQDFPDEIREVDAASGEQACIEKDG